MFRGDNVKCALLTVVSSFLISSAFPPFDKGIIAWFGLSPLLFALRKRDFLAAAILGFLFGSLFFITSFPWAIQIKDINLPKFLVGLIVFSLYFLIFGLLYKLISRRTGSWIIIIGAPSLWVALEYVRSNLFFLSWPWNLMGHSQYRYLPVIQIADITGVYGISFLMVMVNQLLSQVPEFFSARKAVPIMSTTARAYGKTWIIQLLNVVLLLLLTFFYGWHNLSMHTGSERHLRVALVQPNILARDNMPLNDQIEYLQAYMQLTKKVAETKPDLIIWPASSLPAPISSRLVRFAVPQLAYQTGTYLLVGGAGHEKDRPRKVGDMPYSNSEFLISPLGRIEGQYNKIRLLPFNEYVPLRGKITWPTWITALKEDFIPGEKYTLFQVRSAIFGVPICWENMFPDLFRRFVKEGSQFMVSATNEGFFGNTPAPYQSLAINVFRSVENRISIARAATTGVSAFISSSGQIVDRIRDSHEKDIFISGTLVKDMPLSDTKTFYTIHGDIFAYASIISALLIILASLFRFKGPLA